MVDQLQHQRVGVLEVGDAVQRDVLLHEAPANRSGSSMMKGIERVWKMSYVPRASLKGEVQRLRLSLLLADKPPSPAPRHQSYQLKTAFHLGCNRHQSNASGAARKLNALDEHLHILLIAGISAKELALERATAIVTDKRPLKMHAENLRALRLPRL